MITLHRDIETFTNSVAINKILAHNVYMDQQTQMLLRNRTKSSFCKKNVALGKNVTKDIDWTNQRLQLYHALYYNYR